MNNKKKSGLLIVLVLLGVFLITAGITYAFFTYTKQGDTTNTIKTGTLTFKYSEDSQGVTIGNAMPKSDSEGMSEEDDVFNFSITSDTTSKTEIKYDITAKKLASSTLDDSSIKMYMTSDILTGNQLTTVKTYQNLINYVGMTGAVKSITLEDNEEEKLIYTNIVPKDTPNYSNNFTLKMWLSSSSSEGVQYSPYEYVLTSAVNNSEVADFKTLLENNQILTSINYYQLTDSEQENYSRIKYVDEANGKLITVSQNNSGLLPTATMKESEQYYALNNKTFSIKINVYANAEVSNIS